jgi:hypothetical protein
MCSTAKPCTSTLHLRKHIVRRAAYYMLLEGQGSAVIVYRMQVRGSIYPLHCHRTCS